MLRAEMYIFLEIFCIFLVTFRSQATARDFEYKSYENYKVFALQNGNGLEQLLETMKQLDGSLNVMRNATTTQILVAPDLVNDFKQIAIKNQLQTHLLIDDFTKVKEKCHGAGTFSWTAYYNVAGIHAYLRNMSSIFPKWAKFVSAGKSYEGREILGLRVKTPGASNKPVMFIESGIHAREWIAPATITYFINQLLTSKDPEIQNMREQFEWHIFPSVNPDGYQYSCDYDRFWRKTRSKSQSGCYGADPNRNWDYNWMQEGASKDPCSEVYGGTKAFSETETKSLAQYVAGLKNLKSYIGFHSCAQMLLLPYSDTQKHMGNYNDMVQIGNVSKNYGFKVNQAQYGGPATAAEILYAVAGGSMDWVKYTLHTPLVLTYELRGSFFEWPAAKIHEQGDEVTQMLLGLVTEARKLGYFK